MLILSLDHTHNYHFFILSLPRSLIGHSARPGRRFPLPSNGSWSREFVSKQETRPTFALRLHLYPLKLRHSTSNWQLISTSSYFNKTPHQSQHEIFIRFLIIAQPAGGLRGNALWCLRIKQRCEISGKSSSKHSLFFYIVTSIFKHTNTLLKWIEGNQASCSFYKENSICWSPSLHLSWRCLTACKVQR